MFRALIRLFGRGTIDPSQLQLPLGLPEERLTHGPPPAVRPTPPSAPSTPALPAPPASHGGRGRCGGSAQAHSAARRVRRIAVRRVARADCHHRLPTARKPDLAYYRLATPQEPGLIVISRRHMRRHGWAEV